MSVVGRAFDLFRAWLWRAVTSLERRSPEALLDLEKEKLEKRRKDFRTALVKHAAEAARLTDNVKHGIAKQSDLTSRVRAFISSGNEAAAGRAALELKRVTELLEVDRQKAGEAEARFRDLKRRGDAAVAEARANIQAIARQISDTKMQRAVAELERMAAQMIDDLGATGDSFNRLRNIVTEQQLEAGAELRVASSRDDADALAQREAEQRALEQEALREFRASEQRPPSVKLIPDRSREPEAGR